MIPRLSQYIKELLKFTIDCMKTVDIQDYFEFIVEILKFYEKDLELENLFELLDAMLDRLEIETQTCLKTTRKITPVISNIWNLIDHLCYAKTFTSSKENLSKLETKLQPAFEYITYAKKIDFDEDILRTMTYFIQTMEYVSPTMEILFDNIQYSYQKDGIFKAFFNCVYAYCKYGH